MENLDKIIESLLFVSGNEITLSDIMNYLQISKEELNQAVKSLKEKYNGDSGILLLCFNNKLQFGSNPKYTDEIGRILNPIKEKELTNATLETIAIMAYRQPVTRLEVEQVRGSSSDYAIQVLLNHGLIEVIGRKDTVGKPLLYGTTDAFLKRFQIESLEQLPDYEQLLENIKIINENTDTVGLYNEFEIPEDKPGEVPEFLKDEKNLEIVNSEEI